jgi:hypothetical protein
MGAYLDVRAAEMMASHSHTRAAAADTGAEVVSFAPSAAPPLPPPFPSANYIDV